MSKIEELKNAMGNSMAENLGVREPVPMAIPVGGSVPTDIGGQFQGRNRAKNAAVIDIDRLIPDPDQPRKYFDETELQRLSDSLREQGQLQPIRVRWDSEKQIYVILMGERRYRAAKKAGLKSLDCVVHEGPLSEDQRLELAMIENAIRQDLNPIENAQAMQRLMDQKKCSMRDLAKVLHTTAATVSRSLSLLKLPPDLQEKVACGKIPSAVAREIVQLSSEDEMRQLAERYASEGLTSKAVSAEKNTKSAEAAPAAGSTQKKSVTVASGVTVTVSFKKKQSNAELAQWLRQAAELLEADGRSRGRKAA